MFECFISKRGEVPVHTVKERRRSSGIAPLIRHLGCRWRWVVSLTPRSLCPRGRVFYFVDLIWFVVTRLNRWKKGEREGVERNVLEISTLTNVPKFYTAVYRSPTVKFLICFKLIMRLLGAMRFCISCPRSSPRILLQFIIYALIPSPVVCLCHIRGVRKVAKCDYSVRCFPPVHLHLTTRLPLNGFSWNFVSGDVLKICR